MNEKSQETIINKTKSNSCWAYISEHIYIYIKSLNDVHVINPVH